MSLTSHLPSFNHEGFERAAVEAVQAAMKARGRGERGRRLALAQVYATLAQAAAVREAARR